MSCAARPTSTTTCAAPPAGPRARRRRPAVAALRRLAGAVRTNHGDRRDTQWRGRSNPKPDPEGRCGRGGWPRCAVSLGTSPASTRPPRCHHWVCWCCRQHWRPPFIYTSDDIATLLTPPRHAVAVARRDILDAVRVAGRHRHARRRGICLERSDIDWEHGVLLIRQSKFGKSRNVPVTASTLDALHRYALLRTSFALPGNHSFFVSLTGRRLIYVSVFEVFDDLRDAPGSAPIQRPRPNPRPSAYVCRERVAGLVPRRRRTSPRVFPGCRPILGTANHALPTGICRPHPNCWLWRRNVSNRS